MKKENLFKLGEIKSEILGHPTFKGRAAMAKKISNMEDFLRAYRTEAAIENLLLKEAGKIREEAVGVVSRLKPPKRAGAD